MVGIHGSLLHGYLGAIEHTRLVHVVPGVQVRSRTFVILKGKL